MSTTLETSDMSSIGTSDAEVDAAWRDEIKRRVEDIRAGRVQMLDMDESHAQLRARLAAKRQR